MRTGETTNACRLVHCAHVSCIFITFRVNDDTEMLSPGWTEVYINALQVRHQFSIDFVHDIIDMLSSRYY